MKKIYVTVVAVILVVVAAMLIAPTDYAVKRQVDINKPDTVVFSYLKLLKNQDEFSVWARMDPAMKKSYAGEDGTVGFISAWESDDENVGSGEQEIMAIEEGKRIDYELRFIKPYEATGKAYMEIEPLSADSTRVTWGFERPDAPTHEYHVVVPGYGTANGSGPGRWSEQSEKQITGLNIDA